MATGTKLSPTTRRDKAAAGRGFRQDERQTRAQNKSEQANPTVIERSLTEHPIRSSAADEPDRVLVERVAYEYWEERGRPEGSPQEDWLRAEAVLRKDFDR